MIGRAKEVMIGEQAIASIAARTAHAVPILCIAGKRGVGRSRFLDHLKPYAQRMEMDAYMMDASHSSFDQLTRLSKVGTESDQPTALQEKIQDSSIALQ